MLLFQVKSAFTFFRVVEISGQIHVADGSRCAAGDKAGIHAAGFSAVHVAEAGAGLSQLPGGDIEQWQGAEDIATFRLALHALAQPEQRRPPGKNKGCLFNERRVNAGQGCGALRRGGDDFRFDAVKSQHMPVDKAAVQQACSFDDVEHAKGQRRITARAQLQMNVSELGRAGGDGIDDNECRIRGLHPTRVHVGRAVRGVGAPDHQASGTWRSAPDRSLTARCRTCRPAPHGPPCCKRCRGPLPWHPGG